MIHHIEGTHVCNTSGVYQPPHRAMERKPGILERGQSALASTKRTFPLRSWAVVLVIAAVVIGTSLALAGVKAPQL